MDYKKALHELKDGQIDEINVEPKDFPQFQQAWADFPYQNTVRGIAHRAGKVTYQRAK